MTASPTTTPATFADLGVPHAIVDGLIRRKIGAPFPIQAATIPDALAGRDICGKAPTGSGKTIAFGIPLVVRVDHADPHRPTGLVLVPTRELAAQVAEELRQLAGSKGARIAEFYGGVGFDKQLRALRKGVDVAVACPGRLADLVQQGQMDLSDVDLVVLDEADRMADMGFLPEVKRILDQCRDDRQTLLFSATLDGDVDVLIKRYQTNPARHEVAVEERDLDAADHRFWSIGHADRVAVTAAVVHAQGPTIVFCRTRRGADRVADQLKMYGVRTAAIHGNRSQGQRQRALDEFDKGRVAALVATDVAARGIHVDGVACVVHFDMPGDHKDYVHRSGRTARAGATGVVIGLVLPDGKKEVKSMQRSLGLPQHLDEVDLASVGAVPAKKGSRPAEARRSERQSRPKSRTTSGRATSPRSDVSEPGSVDGEGKRRPSGASRRKSKKLNVDPHTASTPSRGPANPTSKKKPAKKRTNRPNSGPSSAKPSSHRKGQSSYVSNSSTGG